MKPKQFNFIKNCEIIRSLEKESGIRYGIERNWQEWTNIAEYKRDDPSNVDPSQAEAEYLLDMMTLKVKKWDRHWLVEWMRGGNDIPVDFALGVAEALYPDKEWEIPEKDEYYVVTDLDRTIVFDFLNFDQLPAGASLFLAGDKKYEADDCDIRAAIDFKKQAISRLEESLSKMRFHIEYADNQFPSEIVPLRH